MTKHNKSGRSAGEGRYFALHHYMLKTDAWRALSANARAVYIQIGSRYDGFNNGRIALSVRDAAAECDLNKDTASRCFKELVDLGFIEETRHGGLSRKTRIASEWRMTAFKCDLTGAFKSALFLQRGEQARDHRLSRSRPQTGRREPARLSQTTPGQSPEPVPNEGRECPKRGDSLSQMRGQSTAECPKRGDSQADFGGSPVPNEGTHIVYHVGGASLGEQTDARLTTSGFPPPIVADTPTPGDALPSQRPTDRPAALAKLAWSKPVVTELFGSEALVRRAEMTARQTPASIETKGMLLQ